MLLHYREKSFKPFLLFPLTRYYLDPFLVAPPHEFIVQSGVNADWVVEEEECTQTTRGAYFFD